MTSTSRISAARSWAPVGPRTLLVALFHGCVLLAAAAVTPCAAQTAPTVLKTAAGQPVEGLARVGLSGDGTRVVVAGRGDQFDAVLGTDIRTVIVDAHTGALVFVSPEVYASGGPQRLPEDIAPTVRLSNDGQHVFYRTGTSPGYELVVRDLRSNAERVVASTTGQPTLVPGDLDATGTRTAFLSMFSPTAFTARLYVADATSTRPIISPLCANAAAGTTSGSVSPAGVRLSADGRTLSFAAMHQPPNVVIPGRPPQPSPFPVPLPAVADADSGAGRCLEAASPNPDPGFLSRDGRVVVVNGDTLLDTQTGARSRPFADLGAVRVAGLSDDARYVLGVVNVPARFGRDAYVHDTHTGVRTRIGLPATAPPGALSETGALALSADGATVVFQSARADLGNSPGAASGLTTYLLDLDVDNDGLHDAWETAYGLNPSDATDPSSDVDADGLTAAQEYAAGTHPTAAPVRYFAEGANGSFFATTLALFNPGDTAFTANVRFLGPGGATVSYPVHLPARTPVRIVTDDVGLPFTEFSMLVEAPGQVVAERRMTWDRAAGYGSHASSGVEAPSTTWHFAEGATISGIQTFVLLQNPGTMPATVTMRYLLSNGTPQERQHVVPAQSRVTVWVNQEGAPMQAAEFATVVQSDRPIVAERAVYRDVGAQIYGAGSAAAGLSAPLTEWSFAEGATGDFFDTYLLLANPSDQPIEATVRFVTDVDRDDLGPTLSPVIRTYQLAPRARLTVRVADQDPVLAARQVSLLVTSTAPIVAERAMWWPGPTPATWAESHADTGAGPVGSAWAVADIQVDAAVDEWDTFLLVNAPESTGPLVRIRLACEDGTTVDRTLALLPYRVTLWMRYDFPETVGRRCGATLESLPRKLTSSPSVPPNRAPMRVEKAMYSGNFSAGTATSGTRLPAPVEPPP